MEIKKGKCSFIKFNGDKCNAWAMTNSDFCFTHNPNTKERKRAAIIKGGKMSKKNHSFLPPITLNQPKDVVNLLATTINEVRSGSVELRVANCIGYLSGHLIKAIEIADLGERVSKLEQAIDKK